MAPHAAPKTLIHDGQEPGRDEKIPERPERHKHPGTEIILRAYAHLLIWPDDLITSYKSRG